MLGLCTPAERHQQFVRRALLRRTAELGIAFRQGRQLARDNQHPPRLDRWFRPACPPQRHRQRGPQHRPDRRHVVVGEPAAHFEHVRSKHGLGVRRLDHRLDCLRLPGRPGWIVGRRRTGADADQTPAPDVHDHARAGHDRVSRLAGRLECQRAEERQRHGDFDQLPVIALAPNGRRGARRGRGGRARHVDSALAESGATART